MDSRLIFVDVGHNIFISHRDACDHWHLKEHIIHIWRDDMPGGNSCNAINSGSARGLVINYKDGETLLNADVSMEIIADFFRGNYPTLVHCTVGQTRSPTVAIVGKIVRGADPYTAIADIIKATWETRRFVANLCITPLKDIFLWAEEIKILKEIKNDRPL